MDEDETILASDENDDTNEEETLLAKEEEASEKKTSEKEGDDKGSSEDSKEKKADEDKAEGAPDEYEDFSIPENMELDKDLLEKAVPLFKEIGLTQEQAQKLVDFQTSHFAEQAEKGTSEWSKTIDAWKEEAKADKEIGGKDFDENVATARKAVEAFGGDDLKEMMNVTGTGNHPAMIRFLYKIGKAVADDKIFQGNAAGGERDPAKIMFPTMN